MATIILVRHGENDWVKEHRLAGWLPGVHLNDNGRKQAAAVADRLAHLPIKAVYSSPLERCLETAVAIAQPHGLPIIELAEVGEVRYGRWQGEAIKTLAQEKSWHAVQHYPSRFQFPQGEALREAQFRAIQALEQLVQAHTQELIVVVSHADLIKLMLAHYLGVHLDLFQRLVISPASVSVIALMENGAVQVLRINDTGPLLPLEKTPEAAPDEKKE